MNSWTISRRIIIGFAAMLLITVVLGATAFVLAFFHRVAPGAIAADLRAEFQASATMLGLHKFILWGGVSLAIAQVPFILNLFWSIWKGEKVNSDNPWIHEKPPSDLIQ